MRQVGLYTYYASNTILYIQYNTILTSSHINLILVFSPSIPPGSAFLCLDKHATVSSFFIFYSNICFHVSSTSLPLGSKSSLVSHMTAHTLPPPPHTKDRCLLFAFPNVIFFYYYYYVTSASCHCLQCDELPLTHVLFSVSAAHNVTLEEILSSYKQACQKLNCKPIPKVLKQIQVRPTVLSL